MRISYRCVGLLTVFCWLLTGGGCYRVHREVPPGEVLFEGRDERDFVRSAIVRVSGFGPVGRHLDDIMFASDFPIRKKRGDFHADRPEIVLIEAVREEREDLVRCRVGRDVPVLRLARKQKVADASADDICFETRFRERFQCFDDRGRDLVLHISGAECQNPNDKYQIKSK